MLNLLGRKLSLQFFWLNSVSVLVFAILYTLQDRFIINYSDLAKKLGLLRENYNKDFYSSESSGFLYYLWYSLITQTTVGYAGAVNTKTGLPVPFSEAPNRIFKVLNILQLLSVLFFISIA
tara:strand:- start:1349 stop:1711 length:363 start_codon:yes stop_codon:yes gene_type:complete